MLISGKIVLGSFRIRAVSITLSNDTYFRRAKDVARLVDLAAPAWNVHAGGAPDRLANGFRAVDNDDEMAALGIEVSLDQVVEKGLHDGGVLDRAIDDAQGSEHRHAVLVAHVNAGDLDRHEVEMGNVERHPFVVPGLRQGLDRRDTADLDRPSPCSTGIPVSGSRTALPDFRVATFITIRLRPTHGADRRSRNAPKSSAGSPLR